MLCDTIMHLVVCDRFGQYCIVLYYIKERHIIPYLVMLYCITLALIDKSQLQ